MNTNAVEPVVSPETVREALTSVIDPELGLNIVDLGLVYDIQVEGALVKVKMTLTTHGCPMHESLMQGVRLAALKLEPVMDVDVELVWDPPWSPEMMSDEAKDVLGVR